MLRSAVMLSGAKHLIRTMAMMGLWFPACGEDAAPGSGSKGEVSYSEGEGEGDQPGGEGEGEGEDARPPGADGEPCGGPSNNTCQDGFQCGAETEEPRICTCPQWMEGTWWAEFPEVRRTDGQEYDFTHGIAADFWAAREIAFNQNGCAVRSTTNNSFWDDNGSGDVVPPDEFHYEVLWDNDPEHPLRSTGRISEDGQSIFGTCSGEDTNWDDLTFFPVSCTFTLTRR